MSPRRLAGALFALVGVLYVTAFPYHPALRSPNELCRLLQTRALVDHGTFALNASLREYGRVGDLSVKDGVYYPSKAPLLSVLAVPIYAVLKWAAGGEGRAVSELALVYWARLFLTVLPTLLLLVWVRRFLVAQVAPAIADAVTVTYALGSLAFSYSLLFMSHQTTAALLFASFYALWRSVSEAWRPWGFVVSGAFAGAAVACEYTSALGVLGIAVYGVVALRSRVGAQALAKAVALAGLGALPFVLALMAYHQAAFGHPLHSGYKYLADAAYQPWHLGGFLGIRTPDPRAFALSFFSPLRGLFTLSPFLLLALPGLWLLRQVRSAEGKALFAATLTQLVGYAYFTSSFSYDSWGWTTGPRHLTPLAVFLLPAVAAVLARLVGSAEPRARGAFGVAAGLCAVSVVVTGALTLLNYIPDSVSSPLFGLAWPLYSSGLFPPSVLAVAGVSAAWPGVLLLVALFLAAAGVLALLLPPQAEPVPSWVGAVTAVVLVLWLHAAMVRGDPHDEGAVRHLTQVWLVRP